MSFGLPEETLSIIRAILVRHPQVDSAIIYGSRAKGTYRPGSDIDLTLVGSRLSHDNLLHIMGELDESATPYTVDVSIFNDINDIAVRDHIERRGKVFYQSGTDR